MSTPVPTECVRFIDTFSRRIAHPFLYFLSLMRTVMHERSSTGSGTQPVLLVLFLLFVGSGCSALIYEVVWFQLLQLVIGSSAVSLGVLLATFMGGMCIGSLLLPRVIGPSHHPLRVYAVLELLIGIIAIVLLWLVPQLGRIYSNFVGHGLGSMLMRALVCSVCLLPPTILMGATLPAIARWVQSTPTGVARLGLFYGANIGGAVIGCLAAGFYLLRLHDMATATFVGAAINGLVAVVSLAMSAVADRSSSDTEVEQEPVSAPDRSVGRLRRGRPVGSMCSGRGGALDQTIVIASRCDRLHVFAHPGGFLGGTGFGEQLRRDALTTGPAAGSPGHLPGLDDGGEWLGRVFVSACPPVPAD